MANIPDHSSALTIYLRLILRQGSNIKTTLRLVTQKRLCRCKSHCEVEEAGIWEAVLPAMHTDERDEFQRDLHMPRPAGSAKGGSDYWMCELWLWRVFVCGLMHIRYDTTRCAWLEALGFISLLARRTSKALDGMKGLSWPSLFS